MQLRQCYVPIRWLKLEKTEKPLCINCVSALFNDPYQAICRFPPFCDSVWWYESLSDFSPRRNEKQQLNEGSAVRNDALSL